MSKALLTNARLKELLSYDASSGTFKWIRTNSRRKVAGSPAGVRHKVDGRIYIGVDGRLYKAHRLAWLYMHGTWPLGGIDHIDGNPANNAISNLRTADQSENMQNLHRPHRDSSTGFLGVTRRRGRFEARISCRGDRRLLGTFDTAEEAHAAYLMAKAEMHPFATITKR